nr:MAG: hypothetical protein [Guiyang Paspalum paspaloides tombus-like virus 2]
MSNRQLLRQLNALNLGNPNPAPRRRRRRGAAPRVVVVQAPTNNRPRRRRNRSRNIPTDRYVGLGLNASERVLLQGTTSSKIIITVPDNARQITVEPQREGQDAMPLGKWMRKTFVDGTVAAIEIRTMSVDANGEEDDNRENRFKWEMGSDDLFCEWNHDHVVSTTGPKDDDVWFFRPPADVRALEEKIDTSRLDVTGTFQLHLRVHYRQPRSARINSLQGGYTRDPGTYMDSDNKVLAPRR